MKRQTFKKLLGNQAFWAINKTLAKKVGLHETLLLQHFIDLESIFEKEDEWFFQQQERISEELGLTMHKLKICIANLKSLNLINVKLKDTPAKNYYKINHNNIITLLEDTLIQDSGISTNLIDDTSDSGISTNLIDENQPTSNLNINEQDSGISTNRENNSLITITEEELKEKEFKESSISVNTRTPTLSRDIIYNILGDYKKYTSDIEYLILSNKEKYDTYTSFVKDLEKFKLPSTIEYSLYELI